MVEQASPELHAPGVVLVPVPLLRPQQRCPAPPHARHEYAVRPLSVIIGTHAVPAVEQKRRVEVPLQHGWLSPPQTVEQGAPSQVVDIEHVPISVHVPPVVK